MMRRLFLVLAAAVVLVAPAGAVATSTLTLTTTWQDLGAGPLQIQTNNTSQALYQVGDFVPAPTAVGFFLQGNGIPQVIATTSHVFVRARQAPAFAQGVAVVVYAPVNVATANGTGGGGGSASVPLASGTGGASALTLGTTPTTNAIPVPTSTRKSLLITNQSPSASVTFCFSSSSITPATNVAGCYTLYAGGTLSYPASGYVPQDAFNAVASAANTPVTVEAH